MALLSGIRADRGIKFWTWFIAKLILGIGQMVGVIVVVILLCREGFSAHTMTAFWVVAAATSLSLILFRILGWKPVKR